MRRILTLVLTTALIVFSGFTNQNFAQGLASNSAKVTSRPTSPLKLSLPLKEGSVRFAVIGDTGSGTDKQQQVADTMLQYRSAFPFDFVLMMGDKFYATLGNHDQPNERFYENFNMNGKEYYRFTKGNVAFYSLNSNYMDKKQLKWLEDELAKDTSEWKVAFCHHPPYSSAKKHGSDKQIRDVLEPLFVTYGVNLVLTGHDHVYERIKPQKGIYYFVSGAGGQLRSGDVKQGSALTDKAFDQDMHFMLIEVAGDQLYFQVISRTGQTVDAGVLPNQKKKS